MENKPKIGLVTEINLARKTATLKFSNGHTTKYPWDWDNLVLLCRAAPFIHSDNHDVLI